MPRPPKPRYWRNGWYTDFGHRNRLLVKGPKNADTKLAAEKELLRLREEARLLDQNLAVDTPFAVVVERFLEAYEGRPVYADYRNQLHWFMGEGHPNGSGTNRGKNRPAGGRFGFPCKSWPIRRINCELVERYLRRRKAAGLNGFHAFAAIRAVMNWAKRKGYVPSHDLDRVEVSLRRKGHRRYMPSDDDVALALRSATGKFRDLLFVYMLTGVRPSELRTVTIDEFDHENCQWVLWRHKVVDRTGQPKVVPLGSDQLIEICRASAAGRPGTEALFLTERGQPWSYNALRLRWRRLRERAELDPRFSLYCLRHWYLTMAIESGEDAAIVSELAGHVDRVSLDFYKKIRNRRLHQAARRVARTIEGVGIGSGMPDLPKDPSSHSSSEAQKEPPARR